MPHIETIIENRELVQEAQELYDFVKFVATSTDKVGRSALLFMPQKTYHPLVLESVKEMIACIR